MDIKEKKYQIDEAAPMLGWTPKTLRNKIHEGSVSVYRMGRKVLIGEQEIRRLLERGFKAARRAA